MAPTLDRHQVPRVRRDTIEVIKADGAGERPRGLIARGVREVPGSVLRPGSGRSARSAVTRPRALARLVVSIAGQAKPILVEATVAAPGGRGSCDREHARSAEAGAV